jgi:hypothetical protein
LEPKNKKQSEREVLFDSREGHKTLVVSVAMSRKIKNRAVGPTTTTTTTSTPKLSDGIRVSTSKTPSPEPLPRLPLRLIVDPLKSTAVHREFIYLNVKTMKETRISLGDAVLVASADLTKVHFKKCNFSLKMPVSFDNTE